jgi:hypothetical protein
MASTIRSGARAAIVPQCEGSCLLRTNVGRKKEEPVPSVIAWQVRSPTVQLIDDAGDVLVTEMLLFLVEVADRSANGLPGNNTVDWSILVWW